MKNTTENTLSVAETLPEEQLDKYSSAITLSDMEIFIYPDLLYSLVLANIMSPVVWSWRDDPWFAKMDKLNPYRRVLRLKQYIMDHYDFNLDLDSWGLTSKDTEIARFGSVMDPEIIAQSNALFGYTGDQYYFDMDIRKHFGLDKYEGDIIPYWKTETVEAMDAFCHREGYRNGAGECVSLSTLYAAALFVVCGIPLEDIFLMATPLHSQNFVDVKGGVVTNNRRIVTQNMWFNGTELSARAQRALRNEQVTMVAHCSGSIHSVYSEASIDAAAYSRFSDKVTAYLKIDLDLEVLCNFLRENSDLQSCFQIKHMRHGKPRWIAAEKVYSYENGSAFKVSNNTREKLLDSIDAYDFHHEPLEGRMPLSKFEQFFKQHPYVDLNQEEMQHKLMDEFDCKQHQACQLIQKIRAFIQIQPRLPQQSEKQVKEVAPIVLTADMDRSEVVAQLATLRQYNVVVDLAFYASRDMNCCDWSPFMKAAVERNPVSIVGTQSLSDEALIDCFAVMESESIYSVGRLAQPDEVWNFQRGDGVERAICLANVWKARYPQQAISLSVADEVVTLDLGGRMVSYASGKGLNKQLTL
ncbi:MAG: hypothetical protein JRG71_00160 [Deltaproteobacteria bacterium]|nr:hypothetical protein [Deltaproteobacteria bacterium]